MVNTATNDTRLAAEITGIDPEQFALGQIHFHAFRVADPQEPDRLFHMTSLLSAANTTADIITAPRSEPDEDEDGPDPEVPTDMPPAPIADEPQLTSSGFQIVKDLIESAKRFALPTQSAERK